MSPPLHVEGRAVAGHLGKHSASMEMEKDGDMDRPERKQKTTERLSIGVVSLSFEVRSVTEHQTKSFQCNCLAPSPHSPCAQGQTLMFPDGASTTVFRFDMASAQSMAFRGRLMAWEQSKAARRLLVALNHRERRQKALRVLLKNRMNPTVSHTSRQ